ncbi:MAG: hypothetical protein ABIZ80_13365 [Bryobacteraceae bacterium]
MSKRSDASRANGAKSKGPITPEGKQRSSRNSLKHGLTADHTVLLETEDPVEFARVRQQFYGEWQPATFTEQCLVETMIKSYWRMLRIDAFEIAMIDSESVRNRAEFAKVFKNPPAVLVSGGTYIKLCNESNAPGVLNRYRTRHGYEFRACVNLLTQLRAGRPQPDPKPDVQPSGPDPELPIPEEMADRRASGDLNRMIFYFRTAYFPANPAPIQLRSEEPALLYKTA